MSKLEKLIAQYPITLYPEPEGGYTVMIVDLVGCLSQGDSLEEAVTNIQKPNTLG
jgi:predicted RNase H-like HicB family nuclease